MRRDIYGNRRSTSSMPINELYDELEFENRYYGEFAVGARIVVRSGDKEINGDITRMSEKAVLVTSCWGTAWFPKSALRILPSNKGWVVCRLAKWFNLSPEQQRLCF